MWLSALSHEMQSTLTKLLVECVNKGRGEGGGGIIDPRCYPQQILCLAEQVLFTERCEAAIAEGRLAELLIELESQLDSYTNADISVSELYAVDSYNTITVTTQSDSTQHVLELKLKALILDTIHNIDITHLLIGAGPQLKDHTHWLWQKQLRHYLKDGQTNYTT